MSARPGRLRSELPAALATDRRRRELVACVAVSATVVVLRAAVFTFYEQLFNSDQAIVGLMAKHASELRVFPLFFYGQNYMLGVQAWMAVPFFWIGGPTVAMLRLPLLLINIIVVAALIVGFTRAGLRPLLAFVAVLPLAATSPTGSAELMTALGASVEPLLYVLILWRLRSRPVAFGALLCVGTLHREFTVLTVPAVLIAEWREHVRVNWGAMARAAAAFAAVWIAIDLLKQTLATGPGGVAHGASLTQEAVVIGQWLSFDVTAYLARLRDVIVSGLPDLLGVHPRTVSSHGIEGGLREGSWIGGAALAVALVWCGSRSIWLVRHRGGTNAGHLRFCLYLSIVAVETVLVYGLNSGIVVGLPVYRYVLFALFLPVALFGAYFGLERSPAWQAAASVLIVTWALSNVVDNTRLLRAFMTAPPPNEHRALADYLVSHRIKFGWAGYWDCYVVDFLARERVILASTDISRIDDYQRRVERNRAFAATVRRLPCSEGTRVAAWCVSDPLGR